MKRNKLYTVNPWNKNIFDTEDDTTPTSTVNPPATTPAPTSGGDASGAKGGDSSKWSKFVSDMGGIGNVIGMAQQADGMLTQLGNWMAQGKTSTAGDVFNTLGSIGIPGMGFIGGLVNTMFGSKLNKENIAKFENQNTAQANTVFGASNDDEVLSNFANSSILSDVSRSEVGSDGWFSSKAERKTRAINNARQAANAHTQAALLQSVDNLDTNKDFEIMANFAADGGPIIMFPSSGQDSTSFGAVDYSLRANKLALKQQKLNGRFPKTSPNTFSLNTEVLKTFSDGGEIHIDPKNRGKFNETKRRTGKTTEELTHSKNPLTRKRAIFAQNARKWKHEDGGLLDLGLGPINQPNWATKLSEINPELDGMIKARLALDSHFGNPTARRMTNYDTRSYTFPDGREGNVYVGSYDEYVTPSIQDVDGELKFIENPWSKENWRRSEAQSMKFENPRDAKYFAKNYKRFAPMMSLYSKGGIIQNAAKWHHTDGGYVQGGIYDLDEAEIQRLIDAGYQIQYE